MKSMHLFTQGCLTHWGLVMYICISKLGHHCSNIGLSALWRQANIWTKCWLIVNWSLGNKLQSNCNHNSNIFSQENVFENVSKMAAVLSQCQCVKQCVVLTQWMFIVRGIHCSLVDTPHTGQWRGALMFSLICTWTNGWANNLDAGDLRHHHAHCNVIVMSTQFCVTIECIMTAPDCNCYIHLRPILLKWLKFNPSMES